MIHNLRFSLESYLWSAKSQSKRTLNVSSHISLASNTPIVKEKWDNSAKLFGSMFHCSPHVRSSPFQLQFKEMMFDFDYPKRLISCVVKYGITTFPLGIL